MESKALELAVPTVPREGYAPLLLNMTRILQAEMRGDEIAAVTPDKASELLATFNRGYLDASEFFARVKLEYNRAEDETNKQKAIVLLDKMAEKMKVNKVSSSADIRQAFVDMDPDYQAAKDRMDQIAAMMEYLKGKMKYLENCFTSVKKIMDTNNYSMTYQARKSQLDGMDDAIKTAGQSQGKFGKAR
jgi:hypothetical protein